MEEILLKDLSWKAPFNNQKQAVEEFASMINLNPNDLIQPFGKQYWANSARVLVKIGYPKVETAIPNLFKWLQDINWAGALIIMDFLKTLPKNIVVRHLEISVEDAISTNDTIWLENLSTFLTDLNLKEKDFIKKENYLKLLASKGE